MNVSIVIADDHGVLRGGLRSMLNAEPDLKVIGEAEDGIGALQLAHDLRPDVLLADISMPGPSGIEVARELIRIHARTNVIVLTMHEDPSLVHEAKQAGAKGFVPKRAAESELIRAIRAVVTGGVYWPEHELKPGMPAADALESAIAPQGLEPDEAALLYLIASACTNVQIAAELNLTLEGVEQKRRRLMEKLRLRNRVDIFRYAHEHGVI